MANQIRKYGTSSKDVKNAYLRQRLASWGFAGGGKFGDFPLDMPYTPILAHGGAAGVPTAVPGGHPDVFDPAIVSKLKALLADEIGSNITNPCVIGWSVGNEKDEIVATSEVQAILALSTSSPAKNSFVDHALSVIYGGSVSALAAVWKITCVHRGRRLCVEAESSGKGLGGSASILRAGLLLAQDILPRPAYIRRVQPPEGIEDLAGNVWEWVADWYDKEEEYRVLRGGSWYFVSTYLRAAIRFRSLPDNWNDYIGFRCVREVFP